MSTAPVTELRKQRETWFRLRKRKPLTDVNQICGLISSSRLRGLQASFRRGCIIAHGWSYWLPYFFWSVRTADASASSPSYCKENGAASCRDVPFGSYINICHSWELASKKLKFHRRDKDFQLVIVKLGADLTVQTPNSLTEHLWEKNAFRKLKRLDK